MTDTYSVVRWRSSVDPVAESCDDLTWDELTTVLALGSTHWPKEDVKKKLPGWSPVRLRADEDGVYRRRAALVEHASLLVLDLDSGDVPTQVEAAVDGVQAIVHTTWSCTPEHPTYRVIVALEAPVPVLKWPAVWAAGARWAAARGVRVDPAAKDACRLYYLPARHPERNAWSMCSEGAPLSWRRLLTDYPAPTVAPVPFSSRRQINQRGLDLMEGGDRARAERYLGGVERGLSATAEGGRNAGAFRAGAALGGLIAAGTASDAVWRGRLVGAAMATGLDQREAEAAIDNGITRGTTDGRALADRE